MRIERPRAVAGLLAAIAAGIAYTAEAAPDPVKACFDKITNAEQRRCMREVQRDLNNEMLDLYRAKLRRAKEQDGSSSGAAAALARSQKAWEKYRDEECWNVVAGPIPGWGSGTETFARGCAAEKTRERIQELKVPFIQR